jgi:6,7-dimethyl-8-ribityllumazine synthase
MKEWTGQLSAEGLSVGIVVSRFNEFIGSRLLGGAVDSFVRHGGDRDKLEVAWVPGAMEIPLVARRLAATGRFDALVTLGAVIRGSTPHFDYVAAESAKGVSRLSLELDLPVIYGILTTDTIEQAIERAGTKAGNKGADAMTGALEMAKLCEALRS